MGLIVSLISVVVFAVILQKPMKRFPVLFYVLTVLVCIGNIIVNMYHVQMPVFMNPIVMAFQKGQVAFAFFVFVMFIGVFKKSSRIRTYLQPVRYTLSIIACILIIGHISLFAGNYLGYIASFFLLRPATMSSLIIAVLMIILLVPLFITSFNFVRKRMHTRTWERLQTLAYPFFALIYLHLMGFLLPPVLAGSTRTLTSVIIYSVIFFLYMALRIGRTVLDRRAKKSKSS